MTAQRLDLLAILRLVALALLPLLAGLELGDAAGKANAEDNARAALAAERAKCERATIPCTDETLVVADGRLR
ncbi:MAG: hypothetical protein U1E87_00420 [Alphaproteobacteria bacterium]